MECPWLVLMFLLWCFDYDCYISITMFKWWCFGDNVYLVVFHSWCFFVNVMVLFLLWWFFNDVSILANLAPTTETPWKHHNSGQFPQKKLRTAQHWFWQGKMCPMKKGLQHILDIMWTWCFLKTFSIDVICSIQLSYEYC
jgi:hypothetical protein